MADKSTEERRLADEEVRKNLPPGVKLVRTLRGHMAAIGRIAWSPDGRMLASPSVDKTIRLWDTRTGECLHMLVGHQGEVHCVAFHPASRTLASGGGDNTIKLWELNSGKLLESIRGSRNDWFTSVSFDPASGTLNCATPRSSKVYVLETAGHSLVKRPRDYGQRSGIWCISFDARGSWLACGTVNEGVLLCDVFSGKFLRTLKTSTGSGGIKSVAFDPVARTLASSGQDNTIELWDVDTGRLLRTLEGHTDAVSCTAFSHDGSIIASKSCDNTFRLWNNGGVCLAIVLEPAARNTSGSPGLAFHPNLPLLATVGSDVSTPRDQRDRLIHIWELDPAVLLGQAAEPSAHYVNAKVVLV